MKIYAVIGFTCLLVSLFYPTVKASELEGADCSQLDDNLRLIANKMSRHNRLRSQFSQEKSIAVLRKPLVSKGHLFWDKSLGLAWHIEQPFEDITVLSAKGELKSLSGNTKSTQSNNLLDKQMTGVLIGLISGDLCKLSSAFAIELTTTETTSRWEIELQTVDKTLQNWLTSIRLSGTDITDEILLTSSEAEASKTKITLFNQQVDGPTPSHEEKQLFR